MKTTFRICAILVACAVAAAAHAASISLLASDNATVQGAGPRTGTSGKAFFNMEASNNTTFASFGVIDYSFASVSLGGTATGASNAVLNLTESNAAFSSPGSVSVYLTTNTAVNIQPTTSPLKDQNAFAPPAVDGAASVDPALGPLTLLGSGIFPTTGNVGSGTVDTYSLSFSGGALTTLLSAINSQSTLRLVVTADVATVAATYAGYTNATAAGPTLTFDANVAPEPTTIALVALGGIVCASRRRTTRRPSKCWG